MQDKAVVAQLHEQMIRRGVNVPSSVDKKLLLQTFTHKSFSADTPEQNIPYNERLEFLGDSILGAVVAAYLYQNYPHMAESKLTLSKIYLVKESTLATVARKLDIGTYIRLGRGEAKSGGSDKDAVLSDALEACIAYVYLECGWDEVSRFIERHLVGELAHVSSSLGKSRKSQLQEFVQKLHKDIPVYEDEILEQEASGNVTVYGAKVFIQGECIVQGRGKSKKRAQEDAAELAYRIYSERFVQSG